MTTAVRDILERAESLSSEEQRELAAMLIERAQRHAEVLSLNGEALGAESLAQPSAEESESEDEEGDDWLDTLDLKLMPPKRVYTARVRFHYVGRMEPLPYDFGDFFDDEEEGEI